MKAITSDMIRLYKLKQLGYDFMAYRYSKKQASYHHMIVPKRNGGAETIQNGAVLMRDTAHDFIHRIEMVDNDVFNDITSEMIDENIKGFLDPKNLVRINEILDYFIKEHCGDRTSKGHPLIKEEYVRKRVRKY